MLKRLSILLALFMVAIFGVVVSSTPAQAEVPGLTIDFEIRCLQEQYVWVNLTNTTTESTYYIEYQIGSSMPALPGIEGEVGPGTTSEFQAGMDQIPPGEVNLTVWVYQFDPSQTPDLWLVDTIATTVVAPYCPPTFLQTPLVSGTPDVGATLTCTYEVVWADSVTFGWLRNGNPISAANNNTYSVAAEDASNQLACAVTASLISGTITETSPAVLVPGAPTPTPTPTVSPEPTPTPTPTPTPVPLGDQVVKAPAKVVKLDKSITLTKLTQQGAKLTWKSTSPKICKVKGAKVKGVKKGKCLLSASAPAVPNYKTYTGKFTVKVK